MYTGGGTLLINVSHTLAVEGYIMSNSDDVTVNGKVTDGSSGGSAGSILVYTTNFTGMISHKFILSEL